MGIMNFKSGYGMSNGQLIDWLTVRFCHSGKGPLTPDEVLDISDKIADLNEPMKDFVFYVQKRIASLRKETDPEAFKRVTDKVREMIEDFLAHPEMYR